MGNGHFSIEDWIDYARNTDTVERHGVLRAHADVCADCSTMVDLLQDIWQVGRGMDQERVPDQWSLQAEKILANHLLQPLTGLPVISAAMSLNNLGAMAVRATSAEGGHVAFQTADCAVELRLASGAAREVSVVGQIRDRRTTSSPVKGAPVFLLSRGKILASAPSNEFGEFQLTCKARRRMQISFPFEGSRIDINLDRFMNKELLES